MKGPGTSGQGLFFRQGSGKRGKQEIQSQAGGHSLPASFSQSKKPEGLGLGLAAAFARACCVLAGDPLQKTSDQPRPGQFGIGLAAAFAPEVKGVGWAVAGAFSFSDAAAGPCWSRGGLVSLFKNQKPKGLGLGLAAAFALGDAASSGFLA